MLFNALSTLAVAALAGLAAAEPVLQPYKLHPHPAKLARMSVRQMFGDSGIERRQTNAGDGYQPDLTFCGAGGTCAEACGAGFQQCPSKDQAVHCYDPTAKQSCCPGGSGDSCDDGFFCSADTAGATWCCPNGLTYAECATKYGVSGGLTSALPLPSTTSAAPSTTFSASATSDSNSTGTSTDSYGSSGTASVSGSTSSGTKTTASARVSTTTTLSAATTSPSNAAGSQAPAGAFALLGAVAIAALL